MAHEIFYWPLAYEARRKLESDPAMTPVFRAVERIEDRLAADPFCPRLGTTAFMTPELGGICATPARIDDWYLIWQRGPEGKVVEIVAIHQLRI
jgi:hypothetical protein